VFHVDAAPFFVRLFGAIGFIIFSADQLDVFADVDFSAFDYVTVQCQRAVEFPDDFIEHFAILFQRVWIIGRHDAPAAKILNANHNFPDAQTFPRPGALG